MSSLEDEQAQVAYRAVVISALKDVEDALVALRGDRERVARLSLAAISRSRLRPTAPSNRRDP